MLESKGLKPQANNCSLQLGMDKHMLAMTAATAGLSGQDRLTSEIITRKDGYVEAVVGSTDLPL